MWNQDIYMKAWNYACAKHIGQTVPGTDLPYVNHVGNVAMEVLAALSVETYLSPDLAVQCALLHDTVEDTQTTLEDILGEFGEDVANGVSALTKNMDLPDKRASMVDSIERIKICPREVWIVKLADRIVNLQPAPFYWTEGKIETYRTEALLILDELGSASAFLESRLSEKISSYGTK